MVILQLVGSDIPFPSIRDAERFVNFTSLIPLRIISADCKKVLRMYSAKIAGGGCDRPDNIYQPELFAVTE